MNTPIAHPLLPTGPWLITLAASAGGLAATSRILASLPDDLPAAVVVVLHRPPAKRSHLAEILGRTTRMPVVVAHEGESIRPGVVYVARPDLHLLITRAKQFAYRDGTRINFTRSSANPLFESAASAYGPHLIAVVLSGAGTDAAAGVQAVKAHGGWVIAQDRQTAAYPGMPAAAMRSGAVDFVLPLEGIARALATLVGGHPSSRTVAF